MATYVIGLLILVLLFLAVRFPYERSGRETGSPAES